MVKQMSKDNTTDQNASIWIVIQKLLALIGAIAIVFVIAGLFKSDSTPPTNTSNDATSELTSYSSQRHSLSLLYPSSWTPRETLETDLAQNIVFTKPTQEANKDFSGQLLVDIFSATSPEQEVQQTEFFEKIGNNIQNTLGKPQGAENDEEYANTTSRVDTTIGGYRATTVLVDINNYDNIQGETGNGLVAFIYVSPKKQITLLYEGHSSDVHTAALLDEIIDSFQIDEWSTQQRPHRNALVFEDPLPLALLLRQPF